MKNEKNIFQPPWKHQFPLATKKHFLNPICTKSDWLLTSPYSIILESNVKIIRIKDMIINLRKY